MTDMSPSSFRVDSNVFIAWFAVGFKKGSITTLGIQVNSAFHRCYELVVKHIRHIVELEGQKD